MGCDVKKDPKIDRCFRMGCDNPVSVEAKELGGILPACGRHGGETRIVWSVYRQGDGWLTDNDTIVDWNHDVDQARWFPSDRAVATFLVEVELLKDVHDLLRDDIAIVRIK